MGDITVGADPIVFTGSSGNQPVQGAVGVGHGQIYITTIPVTFGPGSDYSYDAASLTPGAGVSDPVVYFVNSNNQAVPLPSTGLPSGTYQLIVSETIAPGASSTSSGLSVTFDEGLKQSMFPITITTSAPEPGQFIAGSLLLAGGALARFRRQKLGSKS